MIHIACLSRPPLHAARTLYDVVHSAPPKRAHDMARTRGRRPGRQRRREERRGERRRFASGSSCAAPALWLFLALHPSLSFRAALSSWVYPLAPVCFWLLALLAHPLTHRTRPPPHPASPRATRPRPRRAPWLAISASPSPLRHHDIIAHIHHDSSSTSTSTTVMDANLGGRNSCKQSRATRAEPEPAALVKRKAHAD
jgi:hypothetical protein